MTAQERQEALVAFRHQCAEIATVMEDKLVANVRSV